MVVDINLVNSIIEIAQQDFALWLFVVSILTSGLILSLFLLYKNEIDIFKAKKEDIQKIKLIFTIFTPILGIFTTIIVIALAGVGVIDKNVFLSLKTWLIYFPISILIMGGFIHKLFKWNEDKFKSLTESIKGLTYFGVVMLFVALWITTIMETIKWIWGCKINLACYYKLDFFLYLAGIFIFWYLVKMLIKPYKSEEKIEEEGK